MCWWRYENENGIKEMPLFMNLKILIVFSLTLNMFVKADRRSDFLKVAKIKDKKRSQAERRSGNGKRVK